MCMCSTARWLVIILLVISVWNAIASPDAWNWVIAVLAIVLFIVEMTHKRSCGVAPSSFAKRSSKPARKRR